ncbi:MAG TPA: penicillin-insensitive murein endopeptidase [Nannocystaceae bacterium]|nr:penicillin-insensitive murein endopeptidase [Nannocystaceae bacterium]
MLLLAATLAALLASDDDPDPWRRSVDPSRCDTTATIEYPRAQRWVRHRMVPRETIAEVAARYAVREADVRSWNGLSPDLQRLRKGAGLQVKARRIPPPRRELSYTVQAGDTWVSVARAHGVDSHDLRAYNWPYRDKMREGNALTIWIDPIVHDWVRGAKADESIARGGIAVGAPDDGMLLGGVVIPEGEGYKLRFPDAAYGSSHAVGEFVRALAWYRERTAYGGTIAIGAMSRVRGGPLGGHSSHQTGRDVDIALPRKVDVPSWMELTKRRVDWLAVWDLAVALAEVDTAVVWLDYALQEELYRAARDSGVPKDELRRIIQYPRGHAANRGLVRHEPGHATHLHVRFGCGPCEVECIELGAWARAVPADAE